MRIYGTYEADQAAYHCLDSLQIAAIHPEDGVLGDDVYAAEATYVEQIRKDLGCRSGIQGSGKRITLSAGRFHQPGVQLRVPLTGLPSLTCYPWL